MPSKTFQKDLREDEEKRVKGRHEILGQIGLSKLGADLQAAIEANSVSVV